MSKAATKIIHEIQIGDFRIMELNHETIWISREGGEGGAFLSKDFLEMVEKFFREHF